MLNLCIEVASKVYRRQWIVVQQQESLFLLDKANIMYVSGAAGPRQDIAKVLPLIQLRHLCPATSAFILESLQHRFKCVLRCYFS